jgi:hypothetical protein
MQTSDRAKRLMRVKMEGVFMLYNMGVQHCYMENCDLWVVNQ